jgi:hypothetical protein
MSKGYQPVFWYFNVVGELKNLGFGFALLRAFCLLCNLALWVAILVMYVRIYDGLKA